MKRLQPVHSSCTLDVKCMVRVYCVTTSSCACLMAAISIESKLLKALKKKSASVFYDRVVNEFVKKERRLNSFTSK